MSEEQTIDVSEADWEATPASVQRIVAQLMLTVQQLRSEVAEPRRENEALRREKDAAADFWSNGDPTAPVRGVTLTRLNVRVATIVDSAATQGYPAALPKNANMAWASTDANADGWPVVYAFGGMRAGTARNTLHRATPVEQPDGRYIYEWQLVAADTTIRSSSLGNASRLLCPGAADWPEAPVNRVLPELVWPPRRLRPGEDVERVAAMITGDGWYSAPTHRPHASPSNVTPPVPVSQCTLGNESGAWMQYELSQRQGGL